MPALTTTRELTGGPSPNNLLGRYAATLSAGFDLTDVEEYAYAMSVRFYGRILFVGLLILLFAGLSFNAYACLVPIFVTQTSMGNGCAPPEEPPVRQFCDAFKTLGVQTISDASPHLDVHVVCLQDSSSLADWLNRVPAATRTYSQSQHGPPADILLNNTVLRI